MILCNSRYVQYSLFWPLKIHSWKIFLYYNFFLSQYCTWKYLVWQGTETEMKSSLWMKLIELILFRVITVPQQVSRKESLLKIRTFCCSKDLSWSYKLLDSIWGRSSLKISSPSRARGLAVRLELSRALILCTSSLKLDSSFCQAIQIHIINFGLKDDFFTIRLNKARALSLFTSSLGTDPALDSISPTNLRNNQIQQ